MAVINEVLRLSDQFSSTFRSFIALGQQSSQVAEEASLSTGQLSGAAEIAAQTLGSMQQALAAQQLLYTDRSSQLQRQAQQVAQMAAEYNSLVQAKGEEAAETLKAAEALAKAQAAEQSLGQAVNQTAEQLAKQSQYLAEFARDMGDARNVTYETRDAQDAHRRSVENTNKSAKSLLSTFRNLLAATGAVALTKLFTSTADQMSQISAKLNLIKDEGQDVVALQDMIYQSAQRSRAIYEDTANMVTRLGQNAKDAFSNTGELVLFAENLNKQFVIAGSSQAEVASASLQLTQALSSGVLRGEELNSVFESAPGLIQNIADYIQNNTALLEQMAGTLKINPEEMSGNVKKYIRDLASEGMLTSNVVKNAILSATDEINANFEAMPMTLAQAFAMGKNAIQQALLDDFEGWGNFLNTDEGQQALGQLINLFTLMAQVGVDALSAVGQGALWASQNLDFIIPILAAIGIAIAFIKAQAIAETAATVAGNLAKAASWAMVNWQVILFAVLIAAALIAAQQFGIGVEEVAGWVGQVLGMLYATGYNVFASLWNVIAAFAEFFANVWDDPLGATARLFFSVFDTILGIVETVAGAIDALLGSNLSDAVSGFRSQLSGWVDDTFGENAIQIKRMSNLDVAATSAEWGAYGSNIGRKLDNLSLGIDGLTGGLGDLSDFAIGTGDLSDIGNVDSVGKVKNVEGEISLSDEDLRMYQDLAERRYMNQIELKTLAPNIQVTVGNGVEAKNLKPQDIANAIAKVLAEESAAQTVVSHW